MPNSPDITLHVYQVLEEEYAALHGSIPSEPEFVSLPPSNGGREDPVEARLGWGFHGGHLRDAAGFADYLLYGVEGPEAAWGEDETPAPARRADKRREKALRASRPEGERLNLLRGRLVRALGRDVLERLAETAKTGGDKSADEKLLLGRLNEVVLADPELYDEQRFAKGWLRASTDELLAARAEAAACAASAPAPPAAAGVGEARPDETLRRLNRLLLEDAFPAYFVRIYDVRLAAMFRRQHKAETTALCLSGGGIRSGTFALGVLQGLARHDLLKQFDYLSTVSGGGYVGSWLTAWLHRHPEGVVGVSRELKNKKPATRIDPDPKPVQNLREYSNFITPRPGLLTADTWSFVGIYLRNLLLNWLVFIPLLAAALMLPRALLNITLMQPVLPAEKFSVPAGGGEGRAEGLAAAADERPVRYRTEPFVETVIKAPPARVLYPLNLWAEAALPRAYRTPTVGPALRWLHWRHLLLLLGFGSGVWALAFVIFNRPGLRGLLKRRNPFWHERTDQRSFVIHCLTWLLVSATCLTTYWAWSQEATGAPRNLVYFLAFGTAFTLTAGVVAGLILRRRKPKPGEAGPDSPDGPGLTDVLTRYEVLATAAGGGVAGLLFWVVSLFDIGDPVIGYGVTVRGEKVTRPLFEWADLPQLTWWGSWPAAIRDWAASLFDSTVRDEKILRPPFAWTDWTQWTWWGSWTTELYVCLGVPLFLLIYWAALTVFVGVSSATEGIDDEDREWWARFGAWLLISAIGWLALTALVIYGPLALLESPKLLGAVGGLSGLLAVILGRSSLTPARGKDAEGGSKGSRLLGLFGGAIPVFGAIFLAAFVALVSLGVTGVTRKLATLADEHLHTSPAPDPATRLAPPAAAGDDWMVQWLTNVPKDVNEPGGGEKPRWSGPNRGFDDYVRHLTPVVPALTRPTPAPRADATPCQPVCGAAGAAGEKPEKADAFLGAQIVHLNALHHTSLWLTLAIGVFLFGAGVLLSRGINLNVFSLHGGYRNRLIRAFLGASRPPGERHPNPFTGFDPADNLHLHEMRWALLDEGDFAKPDVLARGLQDGSRRLSDYLQKAGLIKRVLVEPAASATPGLVEALRTELNGALQQERLYKLFPEHLESERARKVLEDVSRAFRQPPPADLPGETPLSNYDFILNRLVLEEAFPGTIRPGPPPPYNLMHVINTSLNLVGGEKLAWQHRKAEPFSFSPLHAGCFRLGYRRSRDYGGRDTNGVSLGTAAAISGAAASSNMGYYTTSPIISLLLTLFNVRLGWWLGNPGPAGRETYHKHRPDYSVVPVLSEAFGLTNNRYKYVYLTDGGHFENLAVYEMVLRRCRFIIAVDGAEDREYRFGDLGNAVRKIRIDLGVPIDFPYIGIHGGGEGTKGMYWAIGRVRYSRVDGAGGQDGDGEGGGKKDGVEDGLLLYIKPAVYGDEPRDVIEYKNSFPDFPHQSTGDQFFDEPQFESYRALGSHIMDQLCGKGFEGLTAGGVIRGACRRMLEHCAASGRTLDTDFTDWLSRLAGEGGQGGGPAAGGGGGGTGEGRAPAEG